MVLAALSVVLLRPPPNSNFRKGQIHMKEAAKKEKLKLDDFLSEQAKGELVGTLEAVGGNADKIKFTPWRPGAGCQCSASLELPKTAIASVSPTGDVHHCCGKALKVVEIDLDESAISARDVISQHMAARGESHGHHMTGLGSSGVGGLVPQGGMSNGGFIPQGGGSSVGNGLIPSHIYHASFRAPIALHPALAATLTCTSPRCPVPCIYNGLQYCGQDASCNSTTQCPN